MRFLILIILLFPFQLLAQESDCSPNPLVDINDFSDVLKKLELYGAKDAQIQDAKCKTKEAPSMKMMEDFIHSQDKNDSTSSQVSGVSFRDESSQLIKAFEDLTTVHDIMGEPLEPTKQIDIKKAYGIEDDCKKVICAMEKIWGKELTTQLLYMYFKHGFNGSELAFTFSDRFKPDEIKNVIIGLEDLPRSFIPLGKNQRLTHFKRGETPFGSKVVANASVMLFDKFDSKTPAEKQYTVYHEMSHNISAKLNHLDMDQSWLDLSGWVKKGDDWSSDQEACYISDYAKVNAWEDFAESVSAFRYNSQEFKKLCPEKYDFMRKKVYKGMEYTSEELCSPPSKDKLKLAREEFTDLIIKNADLDLGQKSLEKNCRGTFTTYPVTEADAETCSEKLLAAQSFTVDENYVKAILQRVGIKDTESNRDLILDGLTDEIRTSPELKRLSSSKKSDIIKVANESLGQVLSESMPKSLTQKYSDPSYWRWSDFIKNGCPSERWTANYQGLESCLAKEYLSKDKLNSSSAKSPLLSENAQSSFNVIHQQQVEEWLIRTHQLTPALTMYKKEFQKILGQHFEKNNYDLKYRLRRSEWKKESPETFCRNYYAKPSYFTHPGQTDNQQTIMSIQEFCVEKQKESKYRKEISEADFKVWVEKVYPN